MFKLLSKNILIYGSTNLIKSLVPFLMLPILTMYLTLEEFGKLSLIETTILFLTPFILLNINAAINVEYFKLEKVELKNYITNALMLSFFAFCFFTFIFFIFEDFLVKMFGMDRDIVMFLTLFAFLRVFSSVTLGLFQVRAQASKFALFTIFQTSIDLTLSYLFVVLMGAGYFGRLEGIYTAFFIASLLGAYLLVKMGYIGKINFAYTKEILKFGIPLIPHAVGGTIIAMSDRFFISYFHGNAEVGLYTVAYQISALMLLVSLSVNQAWSPFFFKMLKKEQIRKALEYTLYLFIFFTLSGIGIFLFKDFLFYIFVDQEFYAAKEFFLYLLLGFLFQSFYFLVTNLLFYEKKTLLLAKITLSGAVLNMVLNYFFIHLYGTIGVAYATTITWFVFFILVVMVDFKIIKRYMLK